MALTPGTRLGVYEVTAPIGEGGMGQVFRARDTKLDRDVAIKVLPEAFAQAPDRLARFQREAKTLASLNHPNIAAIYGLEENGGVTALVMELVEGDKGIFLLTSLLLPGSPTSSSPADCFALKVNAKVRGEAGEGIVVGARCSPSNQITQYWVQKANGERFWASFQELKTR